MKGNVLYSLVDAQPVIKPADLAIDIFMDSPLVTPSAEKQFGLFRGIEMILGSEFAKEVWYTLLAHEDTGRSEKCSQKK